MELEKVLNEFFRLHEISVKEDFRLRVAGVEGIVEQIDGIIELDNTLYLVEMKWYKDRLGTAEVSQHLVRVYGRQGVGGICISASGYTEAAIEQFRNALAQKTVFCVDLEEIVLLMEEDSDLREAFRQKVQAALLNRNPYVKTVSHRAR